MNKFFEYFIIAIFSLFFLSCTSPVQDHYEKGNKFLEEQKYEEAIQEYTEAVKLDSSFLDAFAKRSIAKEKSRDLWGSMEDLVRSNLVDTTNAEQILFRAQLYQEEGKNKDAIKDYSRAIKLSPNDSRAIMGRGLLNAEMGNHTSALIDFSMALNTHLEDTGHVYFHRGKARMKLEDWQGGINELTIALEYTPNNLNARIVRAIAFRRIKENDKAFNDLNFCISIDSLNPNLLNRRGLLYLDLNKNIEAKQDFLKAISIAPENIEALEYLGIVESDLKNYQKSIECYKKVLSIDSSKVGNYCSIAHSYMKMGNHEKSCKYLKVCTDNNENYSQIYTGQCE